MLAGCASSPGQEAAGATSRTLSSAEVDALLAGEGMGMAAPAEINGYPGPAHVLELKEELALTPDQRFATSRLVGLVRGQARALGQRIVDAERRLDADLATGDLTGAQVRARLDAIGALRAQLRFTHIDAHLQQKKILTPEQIARYYELRGRVVVREPAAPPEPTEPLALPVETPAAPRVASPVEDVLPAAPAPIVTPVLPALPDESEPAPRVEAPPTAEEPAATEPVKPAEETTTLPATPTEDVAPVEAERPADNVPAMSPGAQDAMEDAGALNEPAQPPAPIEETPASPAVLEHITPAEDEVAEMPAEDTRDLSPGAKDAMDDAEPVREPPAYPLTPVEEAPAPPALLLEDSPLDAAPAEDTTRAEEVIAAGAKDAMEDAEAMPTMSPGMQDALEFAEPESATEPSAEAPIHIAPLEDELQALEPTDPREPATVDLDN